MVKKEEKGKQRASHDPLLSDNRRTISELREQGAVNLFIFFFKEQGIL